MPDDEDEDELDDELDDEDDTLTCDMCGLVEDEGKADDEWLCLHKSYHVEVLVCTDCAASEETLEKSFKLFSSRLATFAKRE